MVQETGRWAHINVKLLHFIKDLFMVSCTFENSVLEALAVVPVIRLTGLSFFN